MNLVVDAFHSNPMKSNPCIHTHAFMFNLILQPFPDGLLSLLSDLPLGCCKAQFYTPRSWSCVCARLGAEPTQGELVPWCFGMFCCHGFACPLLLYMHIYIYIYIYICIYTCMVCTVCEWYMHAFALERSQLPLQKHAPKGCSRLCHRLCPC